MTIIKPILLIVLVAVFTFFISGRLIGANVNLFTVRVQKGDEVEVVIVNQMKLTSNVAGIVEEGI